VAVVDVFGQPAQQHVDVLRLDRQKEHPGACGGVLEGDGGNPVPLRQLRGPVGAPLADQQPVGTTTADQTRQQRLADLAASDDRQTPAAAGAHERTARRRTRPAAAPGPEGTATRTAQPAATSRRCCSVRIP
jgi:hypothetical protein